jgi:hypothetical protein
MQPCGGAERRQAVLEALAGHHAGLQRLEGARQVREHGVDVARLRDTGALRAQRRPLPEHLGQPAPPVARVQRHIRVLRAAPAPPGASAGRPHGPAPLRKRPDAATAASTVAAAARAHEGHVFVVQLQLREAVGGHGHVEELKVCARRCSCAGGLRRGVLRAGRAAAGRGAHRLAAQCPAAGLAARRVPQPRAAPRGRGCGAAPPRGCAARWARAARASRAAAASAWRCARAAGCAGKTRWAGCVTGGHLLDAATTTRAANKGSRVALLLERVSL